ERDPVALRIRMPAGWWELDIDDRLRDNVLGDSRDDVREDLSARRPTQHGVFDLAAAEGRDRRLAADRSACAGHVKAECGRLVDEARDLSRSHDIDGRPGLSRPARAEEPRSHEPPGYDSSCHPRLQGERFSMKRKSYG